MFVAKDIDRIFFCEGNARLLIMNRVLKVLYLVRRFFGSDRSDDHYDDIYENRAPLLPSSFCVPQVILYKPEEVFRHVFDDDYDFDDPRALRILPEGENDR